MQETESLVQNKPTVIVKYFSYIFGLFLYLTYILICLIVATCINDYGCIYSSLYCTLCGVLSICLNKLINKVVLSFGLAKNVSKFWIYFCLILLNLIKYFLIIVPLFTMTMLKINNQPQVFELVSMIIGTLITPCYIIINQLVLLKINKKYAK